MGYFENPRWGNEGDFQWHDLPSVGYRIYGRYRRDRHRHPWFVLRNNATGEFFIIAPGETRRCPEVHLGLVFGGLDAAVQAMHEHLRQSVFLPQPRGRRGWVEAGIGPELEITPDEVIHAIDTAADIGAELFFVDASWYAPPRRDWWRTVGDWHANLQRFPDGLKPLRKASAATRGMGSLNRTSGATTKPSTRSSTGGANVFPMSFARTAPAAADEPTSAWCAASATPG